MSPQGQLIMQAKRARSRCSRMGPLLRDKFWAWTVEINNIAALRVRTTS